MAEDKGTDLANGISLGGDWSFTLPALQLYYCIYIIAASESCIKTRSVELTRVTDNEWKCHVSAVFIDIQSFSAISE